MAEVVLDEPEVGHLAQVGEVVTARVAQHVGPHVTELRASSSLANDVGDALAGELLSPLGAEQPRQAALADGEIALDGSEFPAPMLTCCASLKPSKIRSSCLMLR